MSKRQRWSAEQIKARLTEKVRVTSDCWEWLGALSSDGYGQMYDGVEMRRTHRLVYELHVGAIQDGMLVCHRCGNKACCNPAHLFLKTVDSDAKERAKSGTRSVKLDDEKVSGIRELLSQGVKKVEIARRYDVSRSTIHNIASGRWWKAV